MLTDSATILPYLQIYFLLFQYIQQIIRRDVSDVEAILTAPETQDEGVWKYEHLRQFSMELNGKMVEIQAEF